jgi:hypothetical protein
VGRDATIQRVRSGSKHLKTVSHPRRFLLAFAATVVGCFVATVVVNVVIDPFWRFDVLSLPGVNDKRPLFANYLRFAKAGVVCRLRPSQVAMGTSRVEVGLDPKHPGWGNKEDPVYNLGLAGSGLRELSLTFQHEMHASPLKRAVIGLDFLMFNANREASVFGTEVMDFDERRLVLSKFDSCWRSFVRDFDKLIGITGLTYSYQAFLDQRKLTSADAWAAYDRDGFRSQFPSAFTSIFARSGARATFSEGQEKYYVSRVWRPPPDQRFCFTRPGQPNTMDTFQELVRVARLSGADVRFYLEPLHSRMMLALQDAGLWPQFEDWKRGIVKILAEDAQRSGNPQFPLWDFSGFNTITNEHIPGVEDKTTRMQWFWEPSHYKKETGDLILDRVLDYHATDRIAPADFGTRLFLENIESWLATIRNAGQDYVRVEPQEAQFIQDVVDRALVNSSGSNCGYYMDQLRAASAALRRGDQEAAKAAFDSAKTIDENDRRHAAEIGVAYREAGFATALRTAEAGGDLAERATADDRTVQAKQ